MSGLKYLATLIPVILPVLAASDEGWNQLTSDSSYCKNGGMTVKEVSQILTIVNDRRKTLASGSQANGHTEETLPPAKNMRKMGYDCSLEHEAKNYLADGCLQLLNGQYPDKGYFIYGEFFYVSTNLQDKLGWVDSTGFSSFKRNQPVKYTNNDGPLLQYANLMRGSASKIGCATKNCSIELDGGIYDFCVYLCLTDQSNIQNGEQIYELGTGENCECDGTLTCEDSLCVEALAEFPGSSSAEPSIWCHWDKISDTMRMHMRDTHNFRRSTLALGQITDNTGAKLPAATNMNYLVWNCTLEKEAHNFLGSCPTEGYQRPNDNSPAQNFYRGTITANEPTWRDMNKKTVTEWWKPSRKVAGPGQSAYFRLKHNSTDIKSYTLMGWAESSQMGCSIAKCGNDWVEACRYYPPGNKPDTLQYKPGKVCSKCNSLGTGPCAASLGLCGSDK